MKLIFCQEQRKKEEQNKFRMQRELDDENLILQGCKQVPLNMQTRRYENTKQKIVKEKETKNANKKKKKKKWRREIKSKN